MRKHFASNPRLFLGTHDLLFGTHDFFLRTHDFFLGTHDFLFGTHDFLPTTHDFLPTTHDFLPTTHDFLPTTHDFLPTTHDPRLLASPPDNNLKVAMYNLVTINPHMDPTFVSCKAYHNAHLGWQIYKADVNQPSNQGCSCCFFIDIAIVRYTHHDLTKVICYAFSCLKILQTKSHKNPCI